MHAQTALPPAPYAASAAYIGMPAAKQTGGSGALFDRYGGGHAHRPPAADLNDHASASSQPYSGARLNWGGKTANAPAGQDAPSPDGWRRMGALAVSGAGYAPAAPTAPRARLQYPSMTMTPAGAAAATPYTPEQYAAVASPAPSAPTSIYDPAPPPAPVRTAEVRNTGAKPGDGPRLYSLHRDYGMEPDPIPLAPQFFGPTADLTAPETPEVGHRAKTATGATVNAPTDAGSQ